MNKKKLCKALLIFVLVAVMLVLAFTFTACKQKDKDPNTNNVDETILAPSELDVDDGGMVTWKRVSGAGSYDVEINGESVNVKFTRFDLYEYEKKPDNGQFEVRVRTVDKSGEKHSEWTKKVSYTLSGGMLLYPAFSGVSTSTISWFANQDAISTVVKVNGVQQTLPANTTSFDLSGKGEGDVTFEVWFVGDGVYYTDSAVSKIIYNTINGEFALPCPTNVRMEGQTLKFDPVFGADIYYLRDYNNTVMSVIETEVDMSSRFLTQSVYAGISTGEYNDSAETSVVYFGEGKGNGSADSPFLISTADEFRYIEFYEGIGEAKHYKLRNDIILEPLTEIDDTFSANIKKPGSFSGVLDGNNKCIKNMTVYYREGYSSLFSSINENARIVNLVVDNADWRTWTVKTDDGNMHEKGGNVSILAYINRGTVENVRVTNSRIVAEKDGAGGLVTINRGLITRCTIDQNTTITGRLEVGGIAIYNEGVIDNCTNNATVTGIISVGGIVGRNAGKVQNSDNYGTIFGERMVGGLVGYNYNVCINGVYDHTTMVEFCSNYGKVQGSVIVGGLVGQNGSDGTAELNAYSTAGAGVYYSYNAGEVKGVVAGGLAGSNFAKKGASTGVVGCFNVGTIVGERAVREGKTRIFVNATACTWVKNDNAQMYCHYWGGDTSSSWPGELMTPFEANGKSYYFVDIDATSENVIFCRGDFAGKEHNKTLDLELPNGKSLYVLSADFNPVGTWDVSTATLAAMPMVLGALCGYNAGVNECYYLTTSCAVGSNANGTIQNNTISDSFGVAPDTFNATVLNKFNGIFVAGDTHPVLSRQK